MSKERVIERIRKLLTLAGDTSATQGEIENAMRFAQRLMAEHEIAEHEAQAQGGEDRVDPRAPIRTDDYTRRTVPGGSERAATWEGWLGSYLADLVGGIGVYINKREGATRRENGIGVRVVGYCFYGDPEACELAADLWAELRETIATSAVMGYGGCYRGEGRAYAEGFVLGLIEKLREERAAERRGEAKALPDPTGQSTAIVPLRPDQRAALDLVHKRKKDAASHWLKTSCGIKLGGGGSAGGKHYAGAHAAGMRDGRSQTVTANRRRKLA